MSIPGVISSHLSIPTYLTQNPGGLSVTTREVKTEDGSHWEATCPAVPQAGTFKGVSAGDATSKIRQELYTFTSQGWGTKGKLL